MAAKSRTAGSWQRLPIIGIDGARAVRSGPLADVLSLGALAAGRGGKNHDQRMDLDGLSRAPARS